jgi:hypothetical protein
LTYWELPSTKKRGAIQKAVDAIESASSSSTAPEGVFPEPERPAWSENREAIAAEHARLSEQMTILEREHRNLQKIPMMSSDTVNTAKDFKSTCLSSGLT